MQKPRPPLSSNKKASKYASNLRYKQQNSIDSSKDKLFEENNVIKIQKVSDEESKPSPSRLVEIFSLTDQIDDEQMIKGDIFKQIINVIEAKVSEFQERLDNRDNLQELNSHLSKLQFLQASPVSPIKQDETNQDNHLTRNKSQISLQNQNINDAQSVYSVQEQSKGSPQCRQQSKQNIHSQTVTMQDVNRINILEKKFRQMEEKYMKLFKEQEDQYFSNLGKIEKTIKQLSDKKEQISTIDVQKALSDVTDNQKALIQHIHNQSKQLNDLVVDVNTFKEDQTVNQKQVRDQIEQSLAVHNENFTRIQSIQTTLYSIDADLLVILKCYKDLLNDFYKIDLIEQQQKRLFNLLQDDQNQNQ